MLLLFPTCPANALTTFIATVRCSHLGAASLALVNTSLTSATYCRNESVLR